MTVALLLRCSIDVVMVSRQGVCRVQKSLDYILDLQSKQLWSRLDNIHRKSSAWKTRPCYAS